MPVVLPVPVVPVPVVPVPIVLLELVPAPVASVFGPVPGVVVLGVVGPMPGVPVAGAPVVVSVVGVVSGDFAGSLLPPHAVTLPIASAVRRRRTRIS